MLSKILTNEREGEVAVVTLNRPQARNALSIDLLQALQSEIRELDADPDVRVVVLTGTDPAFCAGVDLRDLEIGMGDLGLFGPGTAPFSATTTPVIGAINGPAYTGGLELALACDFLIASDRATFADTHARLGVTPGWGLSVHLSQAVGLRRAREMSMTALPIDSSVALAWGLLNRVVPHESLLETAINVAHSIGAHEASAVLAHRELYAALATVRDEDAWRVEADAWSGVNRLKNTGGMSFTVSQRDEGRGARP